LSAARARIFAVVRFEGPRSRRAEDARAHQISVGAARVDQQLRELVIGRLLWEHRSAQFFDANPGAL
jgi:hypothetical protein